MLEFLIEQLKPLFQMDPIARAKVLASLSERANSLQQAWIESEPLAKLVDEGNLSDFAAMKPVSGMTLLAVCARMDDGTALKAKTLLCEQNRFNANARHSRAGGSREKREQIRSIWATGKYSTRDRCADQEHEALGMSFSTARKALRNMPNAKK
jgi:hypothetical protein